MLTASEVRNVVNILEREKGGNIVTICGVDYYSLKNSVHGHDTGMKHAGCGGEIYYDWTVTYDDGSGGLLPSLRCISCKREIVGDPDIQDP